MKKLFWILTVALLAFTACDNKERPSSDPDGIAMIVKNGDMTDYSRHYLNPGKEDIVVTIEYDDYPNIKTGMPIGSAVFDPEMIASVASVHNWQILSQKYSYSNGRLLRLPGGRVRPGGPPSRPLPRPSGFRGR